MNTQISAQPCSKETAAVIENDFLITLYHARIARVFVNSLAEYKERVPDDVLEVCHRINRDVIDLERRILNTTPHTDNWLRKDLRKDKIFDIANVTEMISRIGREEKQEVYEEFLSMLITSMDTVFYTETNRKNIHFPKYIALFKMISSELKLDVAKQQGQVIFKNGEIFLRTAAPELPNQIQ